MPPSQAMRRVAVAGVVLAAFALLAACSGGDDSGAAGDSTAYCEAVRTGQSSLSGDVQDPAAAQAAVAAFDQLVQTAPPAIESDVRTVAGLIDKIAAADPTDQDGVADLFAAALDPSFLAASKRMQQFTQQQCGVDLSGATPSLTTP